MPQADPPTPENAPTPHPARPRTPERHAPTSPGSTGNPDGAERAIRADATDARPPVDSAHAGAHPGASAAREARDPARAWRELVATARRTVAEGLVVGTSGNVSVRVGDTVLVTPSGVSYDRLDEDEPLGVDLAGNRVLGSLTPTSELPMHLAVYRSTDARAVVHTHAVHATAVSTLVDELPLVHYMAAALGGPVRVAPYALYGSPELAAHTLAALEGRTGCLLQNHGTLAYGATLDHAYDRTAQLEWMCHVWLTASALPGRAPHLLTARQVGDVQDRLRGYGQR